MCSLFTLPHEGKDSFISVKIFNLAALSPDSHSLIATLFGVYSGLNAAVLGHCTLFLHHPHIVSLSICCLATKTGFLLSCLSAGSGLQVPLTITTVTLLAILAIPLLPAARQPEQSETAQLLRAAKLNSRHNPRKEQ